MSADYLLPGRRKPVEVVGLLQQMATLGTVANTVLSPSAARTLSWFIRL